MGDVPGGEWIPEDPPAKCLYQWIVASTTRLQDNALSLERSGGIACSGMGLVSATCRRCGSEPLRGQRRGHDSPDPGCAYLRCLQ
jgi:hypothetical protein